MVDITYDIQDLVNTSGVPRRTVYFYVQQGILPPPDGAGLAARYGEDHLLRLRLIPVLRQQGLRLDEIRARFAKMSPDEMRQALAVGQAAPKAEPNVKRTTATIPLPGLAPAPAPMPRPTPPMREVPGGYSGWEQQHCTQFQLPAGITLVAPDNLSAADRQRLEQVLQAARQIFSGGWYMDRDRGGQKPLE